VGTSGRTHCPRQEQAPCVGIVEGQSGIMTTDTQQIVTKAWNFAHVLRGDGLSYTEQITFPPQEQDDED
jgi:hypothetical protein